MRKTILASLLRHRAAALGALASLLSVLSFVPSLALATDFLDPSEAFKPQARLLDARTIEVKFVIAPGYYLYRERFKFDVEASGGTVTLGDAIFPKGEIKFDETFNKNVEHFRKSVTARIPVSATGPFTLVSVYQGCADAGLCYPPQTARTPLDPRGAPVSGASGPAVSASANAAGISAPVAPLSAALAAAPKISANPDSRASGVDANAETSVSNNSDDQIMGTLRSGNLLAIAALFLGLGLLLAFTPCVLPMLPILSSIIVGDANRPRQMERARQRFAPMERMRTFALALSYTLGMALVYTAMGVAAGLAGEGLAGALQSPPILFGFAGLLVLLSLSMFGFYQLQMPGIVQTRVSRLSNRVGSGRLVGVFLMGALSSLIIGPCVAAPLAGALLYIGQTHNVLVGAVALFSLAVGMCLPLILIGISAGALLPRAGPWMESVKRFFGALLLAVAIWMVSPVIPIWLQMLCWATLLIVSSVYLRVFDPLPEQARGITRLGKGVGVLLFVCGALQLIGVAMGSHSVLEPLESLVARNGMARLSGDGPVTFQPVHSVDELDQRIASAGKPVMLDFYADWCVSCKEMERFTYSDAGVAERLNEFTLLKVDVTENNEEQRALLKKFNLYGPPGIIFFDAKGREVQSAKIVGYMDAHAFLRRISGVTS